MSGIHHKPVERPFVIGCGVFGGRSPRTGKRVGERHRWSGGAWGEGHCEFCGRTIEQVMSKPERREPTLDEVIARAIEPAPQEAGAAQAAKGDAVEGVGP